MRPELLSPAGSAESLRAAVQNGADAVYLGCGDFNARRNAKNFTAEDLEWAVAYCHVRGVKVYLTLNTLLFDRELPAAAAAAQAASDLGVDAVLVQDLGVLRAVRAAAPDLPLHASTQMSIHNLDGARFCRELGLSRVVLAREMSRPQIEEICRDGGIETELFVHGAHCMSYSGQCAMSALIGGRSGNRGTCAQPCRLPYTLGTGRNPYPLSLKDLSLADHIPQLCEMGVSSLKIEGRMKKPEYVAVVTRIFADLLDGCRTPTPVERSQLAAAFSRGGFTDGYFADRKGPQMFGVRRENAAEPKELFAAARASYDQGVEARPVGVQMALSVRRGAPCRLSVLDFSGNRAEAEGSVPEEARSRALTEEELTQRLQKTGGTVFRCEGVAVTLDEGLSLPAAAINALRRQALEQLEQARSAPPQRRSGTYVPRIPGPNTAPPPAVSVSLREPTQLSAELLALHPARIYFPLEKYGKFDFTGADPQTLCAVMPRIYSQSAAAELRSLALRAAVTGVSMLALSNPGQFIFAADLPLTLCGDWGLNVTNSETLYALAERGLASAAVSFELRREQIRDLAKPLPLEALAYGRLPLMLTEQCLSRDGHGQCHCETERRVLTDRTGAQFPVLAAFECRSEIENCKVLYLADKQKDFAALGLSLLRLRFTDETAAQCAAVCRAYQTGEGSAPADYTRGLYYRGVE